MCGFTFLLCNGTVGMSKYGLAGLYWSGCKAKDTEDR